MKHEEKYNQYSLKYICKLIEMGKQWANEYHGDFVQLMQDHLYDVHFCEWEFVQLGFDYPNFVPEVCEYYRVGEPAIRDDDTYWYSWNHADNHREAGVSVATTGWLHSLKSVFFGTDDESIQARGVWKIRGFAIPSVGGDDEILIIPMDWAEKTRIRTRVGLERAVAKAEKAERKCADPSAIRGDNET